MEEEVTEQEQEREKPTPVHEPSPMQDRPGVVDDGPPRTSRKRKITLVVVGLALLVIALLVVRGLHHRRPAFSAQRAGRGPGAFRRGGVAAGPVSVAVARASYGNVTVQISAIGTVTPLQVVTVQSQISGYLTRIDFKEGQMVSAGQILAQIDPRSYEAALDQAKGTLARDSAVLAGAKSDLQRYERLIKQDAVSQQQLADQRYLVSEYAGAVEADKAAVAAARVNLGYTHIVSPIKGRVGLRQVDAGNYVTPNEPNGIVVVTQLEPMSVVFPVREGDIEGIEERLASGAKLEVEAYNSAKTKRLAVGKLVSFNNEIDTSTGTVNLRAEFPNKHLTLFPNQFVNVRLIENVLGHRLVIPVAAVRYGAASDGLATYVYSVNPNHTVSVRPVKLGITDGNRIAVESGLAAGDLVVTEGGGRLHNGARVELPGTHGARREPSKKTA